MYLTVQLRNVKNENSELFMFWKRLFRKLVLRSFLFLQMRLVTDFESSQLQREKRNVFKGEL